jgi:cytochrome c peroxidase
MRFKPEAEHGANNGLNIARDHMQQIKEKFPWISYGDLWTLGGVAAVQELGGPEVKWRPGRIVRRYWIRSPSCDASSALDADDLLRPDRTATTTTRRPTAACPTRPSSTTTSARSSTAWASTTRRSSPSPARESAGLPSHTRHEVTWLIGSFCLGLPSHALGRCHTDRSGFDGPWDFSPTTFVRPAEPLSRAA